MSQAEEHLLLDSANLSIILMGVGLLAGMILRRYPHLAPSAHYGRVSVSAFQRLELAIAVGLIFFLYLVVRHPGTLRMLSSSIYLAAMLGSYFVSRNEDFAGVFGLRDLKLRRVAWQAGLAAVVITIVTLAVHQGWTQWLTSLNGRPDLQEKVQELLVTKDWGLRFLFFLQACVLAPVCEEMVFRGFLYPALKRFAPPLVAAAVVAGMFAVIHLSLSALFPLFILALLLTLAYEWSGSIVIPILVHSAFNLTNVIITLYFAHGA